MIENAFDIVLVVLLLWLAWRALSTENLFKGVVLYIAFGLAMALTWVRLEAPDIALAEAAIGTGLTGVLLLDAVRHFSQPVPDRRRSREEVADGSDGHDTSRATDDIPG